MIMNYLKDGLYENCTVCFIYKKIKMMEHTNDNTTIIGTVSGTILSVVAMFDFRISQRQLYLLRLVL